MRTDTYLERLNQAKADMVRLNAAVTAFGPPRNESDVAREVRQHLNRGVINLSAFITRYERIVAEREEA